MYVEVTTGGRARYNTPGPYNLGYVSGACRVVGRTTRRRRHGSPVFRLDLRRNDRFEARTSGPRSRSYRPLSKTKTTSLTERVSVKRLLRRRYPLLTQAEVIVSIADASYSIATIHVPAGSFSPSAEAETVLAVIRDKIDKGYPPVPTDTPRRSNAACHRLRRRTRLIRVRRALTDLGPFDRIYVANSVTALVARLQ